jgi:hypothetical protein
MKQTTQAAGRHLLGFAMFHAFLGVVLLILSAGCLEIYVDLGKQRPRAAYAAAELLICGASMLIASYFLYRGRPSATRLYAVSSSLNVIGWMALGLENHDKPTWWVLATAVCVGLAGVLATLRVRRAMGDSQIAR